MMAEWHLKFLIEEDEGMKRLRHILKTFQADAHVKEVEESNDASEPNVYGLIVRFRDEHNKPFNQALHHFDKVYSVPPTVRRSRYERLLEESDLFDD